MDQEIGLRLRTIRTQLGLSQRHLARVSGVANATISQIEAGRLNPTVSLLKKVLDGVPMSMSEFFADDFEVADRIHIHRLGKRHAVVRADEISMSDAVAIMTGALEPPAEIARPEGATLH